MRCSRGCAFDARRSKRRGEGLGFTDLAQTPGTEWAKAGMFASQGSIPLMAGGKLNDQQFANDELGALICLGDLLNKAGYYQVYMGGADLAFAEKGLFYGNYRFDEVLGRRELYRQVGPTPARSRWGLYDATLFELMLRRISELVKHDRPFAVTARTLDTHALAGLPSAGCPRYTHRSTIACSTRGHCTEFLFGAFLFELRRLSVYERTLVMVMSDHLALRNDASELCPEGRKLLAFALRAGATARRCTAGVLVSMCCLHCLGSWRSIRISFLRSG